MHILVLVLLLYFLPMLDAAAYCKKTSRGVEVKYTSPTEPRSFYCLEVRRNLVRGVASPVPGYYGYCKIFKKKVSDVQYRRHDLETGIRCRYKCGLPVHTCRSPVVSGKCICKKSRPRLIIERAAPVDVYSPHGGRITGPCSLRGRGEGFEFGEIVSCMAITVQVDKTRVAYAPGSTDTCTVKRSAQEETKFMEAFVQSTGVRKCVHVCRKRSPQCVGDPKRGKCACKSRGLVKLLIPLSESETNSQTKLSCKNSGCGPCGVCKKEKCVLKRYAQSKNLCPCGTVCPLKSQLSRQRSPAASILCRQNPALECRAKRYHRGPKPGTVNPDYCYESKKKDYLDTCGCAPGFVLKPLKESPESICVAKE